MSLRQENVWLIDKPGVKVQSALSSTPEQNESQQLPAMPTTVYLLVNQISIQITFSLQAHGNDRINSPFLKSAHLAYFSVFNVSSMLIKACANFTDQIYMPSLTSIMQDGIQQKCM